MQFTISLFVPCKPLNVILSKMSDFALRVDFKETMFCLLFKYSMPAWGRGVVLVLHAVFFSFVGELTKTSARPNAGRDI